MISYIASLIGVFILGFIIDALATSFDGEKKRHPGHEAGRFDSYTWPHGKRQASLNIVPVLGLLAILAGIYGLYLLYLGLLKLMKSLPQKTAGYFSVVSVPAAIVVNFVVWSIIGWLTIMLRTAGAIASG